MIKLPLHGIVEVEKEYLDGRIEKDVSTNLMVSPSHLYFAFWPNSEGSDLGNRGVSSIVFGSKSAPAELFQELSFMQPIITKPIIEWKTWGDYIQTSNMGTLYTIFAGRFELLNAEGNGQTIRELGLLTTYYEEQRLFARIVRAPIVKTSEMKLTVKWYLCVPMSTGQSPIVTSLPDIWE